MLLDCNIKTIAKYAVRRIMCVTPNEAKRLGVKGCRSSSGNSVGVQPTSGLWERGLYPHLSPIAALHWGLCKFNPSGFIVLDKIF